MQDGRFSGKLNGLKRRELDVIADTLGLTGHFANKKAIIEAIEKELIKNVDNLWNMPRFSQLYEDNDTLAQALRDKQRCVSPLSSLSSLSSAYSKSAFIDKFNALLEEATADQLELVLQRVLHQTGRLIQGDINRRSSNSRSSDATASISPAQPVSLPNTISTPRQRRKLTKYEEDLLVVIPETPPETPPPNPFDQNSGHFAIDDIKLESQSFETGEENLHSTRNGRSSNNSEGENEHNEVSDEYRYAHKDEGQNSSHYHEVSEWIVEGGQPVDASFLYKHRNYVEEYDHKLSSRDSRGDDDDDGGGGDGDIKCSSTSANMGDRSSEEGLTVSTNDHKSWNADIDMPYADHFYMEGNDDLPATISDGSFEDVHNPFTRNLAYPQAIESYMEDFVRVHRQLFACEFGSSVLLQEKLGKWESLVRITGQYIIALASDKDEGQIQILGIMSELIQTMVAS